MNIATLNLVTMPSGLIVSELDMLQCCQTLELLQTSRSDLFYLLFHAASNAYSLNLSTFYPMEIQWLQGQRVLGAQGISKLAVDLLQNCFRNGIFFTAWLKREQQNFPNVVVQRREKKPLQIISVYQKKFLETWDKPRGRNECFLMVKGERCHELDGEIVMAKLLELPPSKERSEFAFYLTLNLNWLAPCLKERAFRCDWDRSGRKWIDMDELVIRFLEANCAQGKMEANRIFLDNFGFMLGCEELISAASLNWLTRVPISSSRKSSSLRAS